MEWYDKKRKECWGIRSDRLNTQPILGCFTSIPSSLSDGMMCEFLTREWRRTCKILRGMLLREPTRIGSQRSYMMSIPGDSTKVGTKSYCRAYMNPLITLCVFGNDYANLQEKEIIYKKRRWLLFILLQQEGCLISSRYRGYVESR